MTGGRIASAEAHSSLSHASPTFAHSTQLHDARRASHSRPIEHASTQQSKLGEMLKPVQLSPSTHEQDNLCLCGPRPQYTDSFYTASLEPPVRPDTLRELDPDSLFNNLLLRHDLNFDRGIQIRPNEKSVSGGEMRGQVSLYWDAVRLEIYAILENNKTQCTCRLKKRERNSPAATPCRPFEPPLLRLPRFFRVIRDILKTVVPSEEWDSIDTRLDIELLVQGMKHGACDFISLGHCLAGLLRRYGSIQRHELLDDMASIVARGVETLEPQIIVNGFRCALDILEFMRLDLANHQIETLGSTAVANTAAFEQTEFLNLMSKGWDPSKARDWLLEEHEKRDTASRQATFTAATVDIIIEDADFLPPTLTLDYIRLRTLQSDFQDLVFRVACLRTLASTLTKLEYANSISRSSYNRLFALVSALTADGLAIHERTAHLEDVALEIVRKAYSICSIVKMPSAEDLAFAKGSLRASCERKNDVIDELKLSLSRQLHALVDREVNISDGLTPVQLMDHYVPQRLPLHRPNVTGEQKVLLCLARKIAHITILHWRVWAPLVYK